MNSSPDQLSRWISHVIVGAAMVAAARALLPRQGAEAQLVLAIAGVVAHQKLDAPLARLLSAGGV